MQIALTKKLSAAMGIKPSPAADKADPLFSWTANWTNTFDGHKEDMIVLVNNATQFTVILYGVKSRQFHDIQTKMIAAIRNTLLAMNLNREMVDAYLRQAGDIEFCSNHDRKQTARVNRQGLNASAVVGRAVNFSEETIKYDDTMGSILSLAPVNYRNSDSDSYIPAKEMPKALSALTGKPAYQYCAFELLVSLDLEIYKAIRRLIVPASIPFSRLHKLLQRVFDWKDCHLHEFQVFDGSNNRAVARIVAVKESIEYDNDAVLEKDCQLSDYFPKYKHILYTYDMGDTWEHNIELVRVMEEHNEESPYLLEAAGQTPPEDVGGVGGFIDFRNIILDPTHPEYAETKEWVGYWPPELTEWNMKPRVIHI